MKYELNNENKKIDVAYSWKEFGHVYPHWVLFTKTCALTTHLGISFFPSFYLSERSYWEASVLQTQFQGELSFLSRKRGRVLSLYQCR